MRPVRGASACAAHPDYRGITKRTACLACAAVYAVEAPRRADISALHKRIAKGKGVLKRIGPAFQSTNDNHWRWLLFDKGGLGLKPVERTAKKKEPKVDDYTIEVLQARHADMPVLEWRVQMQELKHRLSGILAFPLVIDDGGVSRAHFAYSQHLSENQRVASGFDAQEDDKQRDSPGNAQNIKDADRRIFVASAPDRCLVHYDWKQVELYRTAWLADDWDLLEAIWAGADIHSLNAAAICGCRPEDARTHMVRIGGKVENARQTYKFITHALDYYLTETSHHWRKIGLDRTEARRIRSGYFKLWKCIPVWQERQLEVASTKRCLINAFGYKLRFFAFGRNRDGAWRVADPAVAVAFAPASEVALMAKKVLPALNAVKVGDSYLLTMTHDSFTFDVRREAVAEHVAAVRPILTREWPEFGERAGRRFAAGVDVSAGHNWGKRTPINPDGLEDLT